MAGGNDVFAYGFGCYLDDLHVRTDDKWRKEFKELLPRSLREEYDRFWSANRVFYDSENEFFDDFVFQDVFNDISVEKMLALMINENEFNGREVMEGQELCLYAVPRFPEYERDKRDMPKWKHLLVVIDKYVHLVYEDPDDPHIGYQLFREL